MNTKICQWRCENVSRVSIFAKFGNRLSVFVKIICAIEKFVVPLHPISRQTKMAAETIASLAQLVEHSICNQAVVGSSPTRGSYRFYVFFLQCSAKETLQKNECTLGISYIQNNRSCLSGSLMLFLLEV